MKHDDVVYMCKSCKRDLVNIMRCDYKNKVRSSLSHARIFNDIDNHVFNASKTHASAESWFYIHDIVFYKAFDTCQLNGAYERII